MTRDDIDDDLSTLDDIRDLLERCRKKVNSLNECLFDTPQYYLALAIDDALDLTSDARIELGSAKADAEPEDDGSDDKGGEA